MRNEEVYNGDKKKKNRENDQKYSKKTENVPFESHKSNKRSVQTLSKHFDGTPNLTFKGQCAENRKRVEPSSKAKVSPENKEKSKLPAQNCKNTEKVGKVLIEKPISSLIKEKFRFVKEV